MSLEREWASFACFAYSYLFLYSGVGNICHLIVCISLGFTFRECVRLANLIVFPDNSAYCFVFLCYFSLTGIGLYRLF